MNLKVMWKMALWVVGLAIVVSGCSGKASEEAVAGAPAYTSALNSSFEGALDAESQLALGLLRLEDSSDAVTEDQATKLLTLYTALQAGVAGSAAERGAVLRQIEGALTESQLAAISAMQLTEEDGQVWLQEQGGGFGGGFGEMGSGGAMPGRGQRGGVASGDQPGEMAGGPQGGMGGSPGGAAMSDSDRAALREQFESMTEEERAQMREQFAQQPPSGAAQPGMSTAGGLSSFLERALISMLAARAGQAMPPAPGAEGIPLLGGNPPGEVTPVVEEPQSTPEATPTAEPTPMTEEETSEATPEATIEAASTDSSSTPVTVAPAAASPAATTQGTVIASPALRQEADTDPGPPLTVETTTNYAESNPNYEGGLIYHVAGLVTNPTEEIYAVTAVNVTFYDASGFRGAFYPFPQRRYGEYVWHGAVQADVGCSVLGPGESCPFTVEIGAQDMASFLVHPNAEVAQWHEPASVTLSAVSLADTGTSYVRINGTVSNPNPYPVKNVSIAGVLLDGSGQMVSMGTAIVPTIATGGSAGFEVFIAKEAYASYALYPTAEQDAK